MKFNVDLANQIQSDIDRKKSELNELKYRIKETAGDLIQCKSCKLWLAPESLSIENYTATKTETVFVDAGYGDDDVLADVTRLHTVKRCPRCGRVVDQSSIIVRTENECKRR